MTYVVEKPVGTPTDPAAAFRSQATPIPKLRVPLRLENGHLGVCEQDSPENVAACVYTILSYDRGSRVEDPEFGVEDPTFSQFPFDTSEWLEQIARYEPRADVRTREEIEDEVGDILVAVGLKS